MPRDQHRKRDHQTPPATRSLRIAGGKWRSRRLAIADLEGLRPTSDRMRETLFNWLMHDIEGARCLDAFAGSGALGIEALSRGASEVVFLEKSRTAITLLQKHLNVLKTDNAQIIHTDTLQWLQNSPPAPFDIVFLDPPFHQNLLLPALEYLVDFHCLTPDAIIYMEMEKNMAPPILEGWEHYREKISGNVRCVLLKIAPCPNT